jgi:hypothetical protein
MPNPECRTIEPRMIKSTSEGNNALTFSSWHKLEVRDMTFGVLTLFKKKSLRFLSLHLDPKQREKRVLCFVCSQKKSGTKPLTLAFILPNLTKFLLL